MDGDAVIVVLHVSFLAALTLRTAVKSCSTFVYTSHRALYSFFSFWSWWRFFLVSWTIRVHFWLSSTDAEAYPSRRAMALSTPRTRSVTASVSGCCCLVFSSSRGLTRTSEFLWRQMRYPWYKLTLLLLLQLITYRDMGVLVAGTYSAP